MSTAPETVVVLEPPLPEIRVVLEPPLPETRVEVAAVGLVGPPGPQGLPGLSGDGEGAALLQAHINDPAPHPAYDTIPNLTLIFENGLI